MRSPYRLGLAALLCLLMLSGCVQFKSKRGVEVSWLSSAVDEFQLGKTTRAEVLKELGPPSQIISLQEETVLYYLYEKQEGEGAILLVYNRIDIDTRYDRAVFFFDGDDRLKDYATKTHSHDNE